MAALSDPDKPALVFIGFMGAGKSTAADAARAAGLEALDADLLLERELGMPIDEFFAKEGEAEFRRREEAFVSSLLESAGGKAVALGGGAVLSPAVREALVSHLVVWLRIDADQAWRRVEGSARPLARDRERFRALHAEREPIYAQLADAVLPDPDRGLIRRAMPTLVALRRVPGARVVWARSASGEYPAIVARGLLVSNFWPLEGRRFRITDATVGELYPDVAAPVEADIEVPPGEEAKTLAQAESVLRQLAQAGMTRSDHLVALGGGVVGDLGGFCAAVYQRGVPVVQVPTTLVAQVDSAYGGKTGVDLPEAKNYVGAYHQPAAVLTDPEVLATLPAPELAAGFVEVIKTALIAGDELWERVRELESLDPAALDEIIFACARTKVEIVAADERDSGRRQALNLGHTIGHAIEQATGYRRYRHGEAVGLGLLAALRLSAADELRAEVGELLVRHGLPVELDAGVSVDDVLAAVERDKKRTAEGIGFVLCEGPGRVRTGQRLQPGRVRAAVEELREPSPS